MTLKKNLTRLAILSGLVLMTAGILPAPNCPSGCGPTQFNAYIAQSQPSVFQSLWSWWVGLL